MTDEEIRSKAEKQKMADFLRYIEKKLRPSAITKDFEDDLGLEGVKTPQFQAYPEDIDMMPDRDDQSHEYYDQYLQAQVLLPKGDKMQTGTVVL